MLGNVGIGGAWYSACDLKANQREAPLPDDQVEAFVLVEVLEVFDVEGGERQAVGHAHAAICLLRCCAFLE